MKTRMILILILCFSLNVIALPKGNSAWLYGKNSEWIEVIKKFNTTASPTKRINYLFPNTASVHVDSKNKKLIIKYDNSVTEFYKRSFKEIKILPDLSFWVAHTNFHNWSGEKYKLAADTLATIINKDQNADGVFLDLESFTPNMLPFYQQLRKDFASSGKILAVIVNPGEESLDWFKSLGNNAFVVLYGYDLYQTGDSVMPVSPTEYRNRLNKAVVNIIKIANMSNTPIMIGIPAIATTREWEKKIPNLNYPNQLLTNSYSQFEYFQEALKICQNIQHLPIYLGFSLWAFIQDFSNQQFFPLTISSAEWNLMDKYAQQ